MTTLTIALVLRHDVHYRHHYYSKSL